MRPFKLSCLRLRTADMPMYAGARTASALLMGNALVVPVLSNFQNSHWWMLLLVGLGGIVLTSVIYKDDQGEHLA